MAGVSMRSILCQGRGAAPLRLHEHLRALVGAGFARRACLSSSSSTGFMPSPGDGQPRRVTLIPGDGIGPEVTGAVERVVSRMGIPIVWDRFDTLHGSNADGSPRSDVPREVLESIRRNRMCLKVREGVRE